MIPDFAKSFSYQVNWRSRSYHAGYHRGHQGGLGVEFRGNVPLTDYPDARRIDINQTIRDPNEQVHVRIFNQKNATPIYAVCDLSGSMQFTGNSTKWLWLHKLPPQLPIPPTKQGIHLVLLVLIKWFEVRMCTIGQRLKKH